MKAYKDLSKEELTKLQLELSKEYEEILAKNLKLDMSRGKPSKAQLDLSMGMMDVLNSSSDCLSESGLDCRNYGVLEGLLEARKLMADMLSTTAEHVFVCGNASLNIMFDMISRSMIKGVMGSKPWCELEKIKWLCPVPGYDRHFAITEYFGIEMILIPMTDCGPDMDEVEKYVQNDPAVKGIWCVPKYSNPQGIVYSPETVKRLAALKPAAEDFRIYWDNAYVIHHLYPQKEKQAELLDIISECEKAGNPNMVFEFASTSKISFPGAGISALASSVENLEFIRKSMFVQTIGYDKLNQLRHVKFYKDLAGLEAHMMKHADIIRPKFDIVINSLEEELGGLEIAKWLRPMGGYFISFDSLEGCAKEIVARCKRAGVVLTDAGATYPYKNDPKDCNIRIAPTLPTVEELKDAVSVFILSVKLVSIEKYLGK